ncbi:MAG: Flp pilus assembly complex ATPase component TadA, partial [Chloroflexi bacterium]|nr:Flp pilus assembly complex ATPase component TadA [Chloroflexota bacterium]
MSLLQQRAQAASSGPPARYRALRSVDADRAPADLFAELKERLYQRLLRELDPAKLAGRDKRELRPEVEEMAAQLLALDETPMAREERLHLVGEIADEVLGLGPLEPLLEDPTVSEIMVNAPDRVYFERSGVLHLSDRVFRDHEHILRVLEKIVLPLNRRIDESSPMV